MLFPLLNRILAPLYTSGRDPALVRVALSPQDFSKGFSPNQNFLDIFGSIASVDADSTLSPGRIRVTVEMNL